MKNDIFNFLKDIGCCTACCVRYLCDKSAKFNNIEDYVKINGYTTQNKSSEDSEDIKKQKPNPCIVCLGLLQNVCLEYILTSPCLEEAKTYDSLAFTCSISVPACILLRDYSVLLHVKDKFPTFYNEEKNQVILLNKAWKMFVSPTLETYLGKSFESSDTCNFSVNISMDYDLDKEELGSLSKMQPEIFQTRSKSKRKYNGELYSRKIVAVALEKTTSEVFREHFPVPPQISSTFLTCSKIECKHNPIYIAGRYCKYSRQLSQSPWIIDGVKAMETSVQELIFEKISNVLGFPATNLKFTASGREDCDVRCLGRGRPFYVEVADPKKTSIEFFEFRNVENEINVSNLIRINDLQVVPRSELVNIKEGEALKTKVYNALCKIKVPATQEHVDILNRCCPIDLQQKTPIRVLHRRSLAVRAKKVYSLTAKLVPGYPHLIDIHLVTQAGTYVKEFVHGDFGRTLPNLGCIIGTEANIIALDVLAVNLDWPKEIN